MSSNTFNILINGCGKVGSHLVEKFYAAENLYPLKFMINVVDLHPRIPEGHLMDIRAACLNAPHIKQINVFSPEKMPVCLEKADIIINTVAHWPTDAIKKQIAQYDKDHRASQSVVNFQSVLALGESIAKYASTDAIVINVSNQTDINTSLLREVIHKRNPKFPLNHILGFGGTLDTARFRSYLAEMLGVSSLCVSSFIIGAHNSSMFPAAKTVKIHNGVDCSKCIQAALEKTRRTGKEISEQRQRFANVNEGSYFSPAKLLYKVILKILNSQDNHNVDDLPLVFNCLMDDPTMRKHFGLSETGDNPYMGLQLPVCFKNRKAEVIPIELTDTEKQKLAEIYQELLTQQKATIDIASVL